MRPAAVLARAAFAAAVRERWFVVIAGAFALLVLTTAQAGLSGADLIGLSAFDRTAASLISLTLLFVPLLGLALGSGWLAAKRESGVLSVVLAQPVTRPQVYAGEFLGVAAAMMAAVLVGFGLAGLALAVRAGPDRLLPYLALTGLAAGLTLSTLGVGFLISGVSPTLGRAVGVGVVVWLALVVLSDLGMLGVAVTARLGVEGLFWLLIANPVDVFRIAAVLAAVHSPDLTGPIGLYVVDRFGEAGAAGLLLGLLAGWSAAPFAAGLVAFCRRQEP